MRYEILNDSNEVVNTILADESFVEATYPGKYRFVPEQIITPPKETKMTKLEFQLRFTFAELVAIEIAAETNPGVRVLQRQQQAAEFIDTSDENTILGVMYLQYVGLITQERMAEILATTGVEPEPTPEPEPVPEP